MEPDYTLFMEEYLSLNSHNEEEQEESSFESEFLGDYNLKNYQEEENE